MSKLKPIGSEKLQGDDKLKRILEIAKYKETPKQNINESSSTEYQVKLADGHTYEIAKEKMGYVIKKQINESVSDYIEPMKNRRHYTSYSAAFKRLNLIAKEVNTLTETVEGISLFSEQKKYTLRTPKPEVSDEEPSPMEEPIDAPMPEPTPSPAEPEMPAMDDEMGPEEPMDLPEPSDEMPSDNDMEDNEDVSFKTIQKLTGKLAQKIRDLQDNEEDISSKDAKYVINSILSAISDNLDEDDKEDIIGKLEGEDVEDMGGMEDEMGDEELPVGDEEIPSGDEELPVDSEMTENWNEGEVKEEDFLSGVFNNIFKESQVDKILKGYFVINENEKKFINEKKENNKTQLKSKVQNSVNEINRLSESKEQRKVAKDIMLKFPKVNFVGKTNKGNLVFENNNKQLKVGRNGQIL
jgi:hypothetical protein